MPREVALDAMEMLLTREICAGAATFANHRALADACRMSRICLRCLDSILAVFDAPNIVSADRV